MNSTSIVITSIAKHDHPILKKYADEAQARRIPFIVVGDQSSPLEFDLPGCDFYSVERQRDLHYKLARVLPYKHYARKNLGYLAAFSAGADVIIETDDDNIPLPNFWDDRTCRVNAPLLSDKGWVNIYRYFTDIHIWPRGFALENIQDRLPELGARTAVDCPIQQGLADENPDVDAIHRLILPSTVIFDKAGNVALGKNSICPFNSQNTTWFKEAFPLLYLPSYCSFRMTDIWRSFIAQRIAWTCGWSILFHQSSVRQVRNDHNIMDDFRDEIPGYSHNTKVLELLKGLTLQDGPEHVPANMVRCYRMLSDAGLINTNELALLDAWLEDITGKF